MSAALLHAEAGDLLGHELRRLPANPYHVPCPPIRSMRPWARCRDSVRRGPWLLSSSSRQARSCDGFRTDRTVRCRQTDLPLVRRVLREDQTPREFVLRPTTVGPREAALAYCCACTLFGFGRGAGLSTGAWGDSGSRCIASPPSAPRGLRWYYARPGDGGTDQNN